MKQIVKEMAFKGCGIRRYVLTEQTTERPDWCANANFLGTGLALVGILRPHETLETFNQRIERFRNIQAMIDEKKYAKYRRMFK